MRHGPEDLLKTCQPRLLAGRIGIAQPCVAYIHLQIGGHFRILFSRRGNLSDSQGIASRA